jgi:sugar lactone lactonase YvrE
MTRFLFLLSLALLVACASASPSLPPSVFGPNAASSSVRVFVAEACAPNAKSCSGKGFVQELGGATIEDGVSNPVELAFDPHGNLYVSNAQTVDAGNLTVYSPDSGKLLRTVSGYQGVSYALAFSPRGALYVVSHYKYQCCDIKGSVAVYAPSGTRPLYSLDDVGSFPGKPAFDSAGNLYVPNFNNFPGYINVYAPKARKPFRSISKGIGFPLALAFDSRGRLYVLNGVFSGGTDVLVYAPGSGTLLRTIKIGITSSSAIALDSRGELYVANRPEKHVPASVTVFAPGTVKPSRTIETGIHYPIALALDAGDNLYVANSPNGTNSVSVYAPGSGTPAQTYRLREAAMALAVPSQ